MILTVGFIPATPPPPIRPLGRVSVERRPEATDRSSPRASAATASAGSPDTTQLADQVTDGVEIRPAAHLTGRGTLETEERIKAELDDPETRIVSIGLAGENRVSFACILNDTDRAAGRPGLAAA